MPLANAFLTRDQLSEPEATYPLELNFCRRCSLVQIRETLRPETLFHEYLYFSSFSETMVRHAERLATDMIEWRVLDRDSLVVEIGSNDGYLLQHYQRRHVSVLGIEPASNIARVAERDRGVPTICEFFNLDLAQRLTREGMAADVIHAHNVLAHVADLSGVVQGMRLLLKDDGVAVIEVPYVKDLVDRSEFDTVYHEHLCYFSLTALEELVRRHGLALHDVRHIGLHGGSLQVFVMKEGAAEPRDAVKSMLAAEADEGIASFEFYDSFAQRVEHVRVSLFELLHELKAAGHSLAVYGAAAKGTVLLNYCGLGTDLLDFAVDRSPYKQGRFVPGVHLPIYPPSKLLESRPSYTLLLAWNVAEEVLIQQAEYRRLGGRFIIPLPEPQII